MERKLSVGPPTADELVQVGASRRRWLRNASLAAMACTGLASTGRPAEAQTPGAGELDVRAFGAVGNGVHDDTAAIQNAINACPLYGTVRLSPGRHVVSDGLVCSQPINLVGAGFGSFIVVAESVGRSVDILTLRPLTNGYYYVLRDFSIVPANGTPGRYGIFLDGRSTFLKNCVLSDLSVYGFGGGIAIYGDTTSSEGTPILTAIDRCVLVGGVAFPRCGDTVRIRDSHLSGSGYAANVTCVSGASTFILSGNSCTASRGVHLGGPLVLPVVEDNEFETTSSQDTGSNGAFLDLDGSDAGDVTDAIVRGNSFQIVNSASISCIRVNRAVRAYVVGNRIARGVSPSAEILITRNASATIVGQNTWPREPPVITDGGIGTASAVARSRQDFRLGESGVSTEMLRFGRREDGHRYNSLYSTSSSSGAALVSVRVHDGVGPDSQVPVMGWNGKGRTEFLKMPPAFPTNGAAKAGGLGEGEVYRTGGDPDVLCIVHR
jgi:Pectate lyase superfamily protein